RQPEPTTRTFFGGLRNLRASPSSATGVRTTAGQGIEAPWARLPSLSLSQSNSAYLQLEGFVHFWLATLVNLLLQKRYPFVDYLL
ncbi:MAG TPA: hypothetical protein VKA09_14465, partial [Nitrososphaeraceae archaeon]|nr:hypothetical protein [Nitrososphaeraceae archaeon]